MTNLEGNLIETLDYRHVLDGSDLFVTGGSGTLGKAITKRRKEQGWTGKLTVYSTDSFKHAKMSREYPDITYICGDVRNYETLLNAMVGHDIVIHGAAVKVIPTSELHVIDTIDVNVNGSLNVASAAIQAKVKKVIGISTDKAASSYNLYGMTKGILEKSFQEYQRIQDQVDFHLVRYGNVLESTGSVVELWKNMIARGEKIKVTDPEMTRFWLSPSQAVDYVLLALSEPAGTITVPKMPALSLAKLAEYGAGATQWDRMPLRPGEKMHETLLTWNELRHTEDVDTHFRIWPTTEGSLEVQEVSKAYTSASAEPHELTKDELLELLGEK